MHRLEARRVGIIVRSLVERIQELEAKRELMWKKYCPQEELPKRRDYTELLQEIDLLEKGR